MIRTKHASIFRPLLWHYYTVRGLSYTRTSLRRPASRDSARLRIVLPFQDRDITDGILTPIKNIDHADLDTTSSSIENFAPLASYDWFAHPRPTIAVPGSLPVWRDRNLPLKLGRDSTLEFVDENILRSPLSPLIPLVASVQYWSPSFDLSTVDIVTDRSNLTKLVNWIMNSHFYKDFRIDLDVSGRRTVLFTRWEGSAHYPMGNGYTETFKWVTTVSDRSRNGRFGHLRMVTYDFAGLKLLVRHEVDACLPTESDVKAMPRRSASGEDSPATVDHPHFTLIRRGVELISQSRLVEVKTRSLGALRAVNWSEIYSRLYLSQTPHTYFGIHDRGIFVRIERKALDASDRDMVLASQDAEYGLRRLGSVLYALRESMLEARGDHALAVLCRGGKLALYKRTSNGLPEELIHAFD